MVAFAVLFCPVFCGGTPLEPGKTPECGVLARCAVGPVCRTGPGRAICVGDRAPTARSRPADGTYWVADNTRVSGSPYLRPEFRRLMDAVTFHMNFDADNMRPDMAEGPSFAPSVFTSREKKFPEPQFADGLVGRALVLGTGGAVYPRLGNVLLESRGAIAAWIQPRNWQRPRDGNCVFTMTSNATFYLERQGPDIDDDGRVRRHEGILYIANLKPARTMTINGGADWKNDQWYLLVANWSWPTMELSVNGGPFKVRSLSRVPGKDAFGSLVLGDRAGKERGLIDEFFAFRRPLSLDEVQLLWQLRPPE